MTDVTIWVEGEPVAKARPRMTRGGHVYTPHKTIDAENAIRKAWQEEGGREIRGPVSISCWFYLETPKSWSKARKALAEDGEILPEKVPDIDNLLKTVLDALNGLAFPDDKEVCRISAIKKYSEKPGTLIRVRAL
jgi:Holliday junction resolvase RusA-like endonuclease